MELQIKKFLQLLYIKIMKIYVVNKFQTMVLQNENDFALIFHV